MNVVTGAFSYTGSYIARELLARGEKVRTLSREPAPPGHPLAARVDFGRLQFADERALEADLGGAETLFNTYWIRSPRAGVTFEHAVANIGVLLRAAERAGVRRIVQIGVANSSERSPLAYFRGKALADRLVRESGLASAIVRPTLIFGPGDVLLNNIVWAMRRFHVFLLPGRGDYQIQPVAAEDVARLAVDAGDGEELDAAGPDRLDFAELVRLLRRASGARARIVAVPPSVALAGATIVGRARQDTMLTSQELDGLMAGLLSSGEAPRGRTPLAGWLAQHGPALGRRYVSERRRNWSHGCEVGP
ncbi:MAG: SDR family oxidoreductase [Solirubrobacteraceae bacterium]